MKLTKSQKMCLEKLRSIKTSDGWVFNHCDNIGFQHRVLGALVSLGLVEVNSGSYRVIEHRTDA